MNSDQLEVVAALGGTLVAVLVAVVGIRFNARASAREDARERDKLRADSIAEGRRQRDDEVARLRDQRDDARRDRDLNGATALRNEASAQAWEQKYNELRDRGGAS